MVWECARGFFLCLNKGFGALIKCSYVKYIFGDFVIFYSVFVLITSCVLKSILLYLFVNLTLFPSEIQS